jgi:chromosome segregation ATPase
MSFQQVRKQQDIHNEQHKGSKLNGHTAASSASNNRNMNNSLDYVEVSDEAKLVEELRILAEETISKIQRDAKYFEECEKKLGTDKDTRKLRTDIKNRISSASKTIKDTADRLKKMQTPKNTELKRQFEKLKREISECFSNFNQLQRIQQAEKNIVLKEKAKVEQLKREQSTSQIEFDHEEELRRKEEERIRIIDYERKKQEAQALDNAISHNEKIIMEREEDILQLEQDIRDINQTFREMNILVKTQQANLDLIEENVEKTVISVTTGTQNLETADKYDKKSRSLVCIIMLIILVLAVIIVIVLAFVLKVTLH